VIDTDIVSFTFKKDSRAVLYEPYLQTDFLTIFFMTLAELNLWTLGQNWGEERKTNFAEFLKDYVVIYPDKKLCEIWAHIQSDARRKGRPVETADAWVASVALMFDIPLVTHNRRHFENIDNLQIISEAENH
jgi:tRNA(fMet)-specific endonuclease VapC